MVDKKKEELDIILARIAKVNAKLESNVEDIDFKDWFGLGTAAGAELGTAVGAELGTAAGAELGTPVGAELGTAPGAELGFLSEAELELLSEAELESPAEAELSNILKERLEQRRRKLLEKILNFIIGSAVEKSKKNEFDINELEIAKNLPPELKVALENIIKKLAKLDVNAATVSALISSALGPEILKESLGGLLENLDRILDNFTVLNAVLHKHFKSFDVTQSPAAAEDTKKFHADLLSKELLNYVAKIKAQSFGIDSELAAEIYKIADKVLSEAHTVMSQQTNLVGGVSKSFAEASNATDLTKKIELQTVDLMTRVQELRFEEFRGKSDMSATTDAAKSHHVAVAGVEQVPAQAVAPVVAGAVGVAGAVQPAQAAAVAAQVAGQPVAAGAVAQTAHAPAQVVAAAQTAHAQAAGQSAAAGAAQAQAAAQPAAAGAAQAQAAGQPAPAGAVAAPAMAAAVEHAPAPVEQVQARVEAPAPPAQQVPAQAAAPVVPAQAAAVEHAPAPVEQVQARVEAPVVPAQQVPAMAAAVEHAPAPAVEYALAPVEQVPARVEAPVAAPVVPEGDNNQRRRSRSVLDSGDVGPRECAGSDGLEGTISRTANSALLSGGSGNEIGEKT